MHKRNSSARLTVAAIVGGLVFVVFVALMTGSGMTFSPALFLVLAAAIAVAVFLFAGFQRGGSEDRASPSVPNGGRLGDDPEPTPESAGTGPGAAGSAAIETAPDPIRSDRAEGPVPSFDPSSNGENAVASTDSREDSVPGNDRGEPEGELDIAGDEDGTAMRAATDEIVTVEEPDAVSADDSTEADDGDNRAAGHPPGRLDAPREGGADDLKRLRGVGPKLEQVLNDMGIYHLDQIAGWTEQELAWVDANLQGFKGRASRDDWVAQARELTEQDD